MNAANFVTPILTISLLVTACDEGQIPADEPTADFDMQAAAIVASQWKVAPALHMSGEYLNTEGELVRYYTYFTTPLADHASTLDVLQRRSSSYRALGEAVAAGDEQVRVLEGNMLAPELFATVVFGEDGTPWEVSSGIPIALASDAELSDFARGYGATNCTPDAAPDVGVTMNCDGEQLRAHSLHELVMANTPMPLERPLPELEVTAPPQAAVAALFPVSGTGWYHYPGSTYHRPNSGFFSADDTYALDLNKGPNASSDCGLNVSAAASGTVKQVSNNSGWVLIEHVGTLSWLGQNYTKYYTGYGHMNNIAVTAGQAVVAGQKIGEVNMVGANSCHLHFGAYVGSYLSASNNRMLYSIDPDTLGAAFSAFNYSGNSYIQDAYVDDQKSSGSFVFSKSGSLADWFTTASYGLLDGMTYTRASTGSNIATWLFNDGAPLTSTFKLYAFIPRNYATSTNATYNVYGGAVGATFKGSRVVNQLGVSDYWFELGTYSFAAADKVKVTLSDATGEATTVYVGVDILRRWRKIDTQMNQ